MSALSYDAARLAALAQRHASLSAQTAGLHAAIDPKLLSLQFARAETLRLAGRVELNAHAHPSEWVAKLNEAQAHGVHSVAALQAARAALQVAQELQGLNEALGALNAELAPLARLLKRCRDWAGVESGGPLVATFN